MIFHHLVKEGTPAAVARKLKLPTFKVHNDINSIEKFLGEPLIMRNQNRLALTEAGQNFAEFCRIVVETMPLVQPSTHIPTELKIATTHGFSEIELPDILGQFIKEFPEIKITVLSGVEYLNFVDPSIDVVIGEFLVNRADLTQTQLLTTSMVLAASESYLKKHGIPKSLSDLKNHKLLVFHGFKLEPREIFGSIDPFYLSNNLKNLCKMALLDLGIITIPKNRLQSDEILSRSLIIVNENLQSSEFRFFYINKRRSSKAAIINRLCEITKSYL